MKSFGAGRYEVVDDLGAGGMGRVYTVRVRATGGRAALKTLWPHLAAQATQLERFRREAMVMGAIEHPHLARCDDFAVEADGTAFLVMELLDGRSLHQIVAQDGPLDGERAARICAQVASALDAAHERGIVHRDLKPSNVIVVRGYDGGEVAKLIDFGVAAIKESPEHERLTRTGQILGTPNYMAPEQLSGKLVDARTDVYGLGALLYAVLAGRPPYPGSTLAEVVTPLLAGDRPPLRVLRPDIGPLAMIVERAMRLDPSDRFASSRELGETLARVASRGGAPAVRTEPVSAQPSSPDRPAPRATAMASRRVVMTALASLAVGVAIASIAILAARCSGEANDGGGPTSVLPIPLDPPMRAADDTAVDAGTVDAGPREQPEQIATTDGTLSGHGGRTGQILEGQHASTEISPAGGAGRLRIIVYAGTHDGDFGLVRDAMGRNSGRLLSCLESLRNGIAAGMAWWVTARVTTAPGLAEVESIRTDPGMTPEQVSCVTDMLTEHPDNITRTFDGQFILRIDVVPREPGVSVRRVRWQRPR